MILTTWLPNIRPGSRHDSFSKEREPDLHSPSVALALRGEPAPSVVAPEVTLQQIAQVQPGTYSVNLCSPGVPPGTTQVFVQAVG
jgi:hypothetical protein